MLKRIHELGYSFSNLSAKHFLIGIGNNLGKIYMCGFQNLEEVFDETGQIKEPIKEKNLSAIDDYTSANRIEGLSKYLLVCLGKIEDS